MIISQKQGMGMLPKYSVRVSGSGTQVLNSLAPGTCGNNFKSVTSEYLLLMKFLSTCCEIALMWIPQNIVDESTLVQVMVWCRQATSHYLNQCWLRSPTPYAVTRLQWVKEWSLCKFNPSVTAARIFRNNQVITEAADVGIFSTIRREFLLSTPSQCWEIIGNANVFSFPKLQHIKGEVDNFFHGTFVSLMRISLFQVTSNKKQGCGNCFIPSMHFIKMLKLVLIKRGLYLWNIFKRCHIFVLGYLCSGLVWFFFLICDLLTSLLWFCLVINKNKLKKKCLWKISTFAESVTDKFCLCYLYVSDSKPLKCITVASWCFKSSAFGLFVQVAQASNKENMKALPPLALCEGNPPVTGGFPSQRASNAERGSMSWCQHAIEEYKVL